MGRGPDFIGLGAQRAGTTWLYACLFDHPAICVPIKEIHFFSDERQWARGYDWYEGLFRPCPARATVGEFSTSYLSSAATPARIRRRYPDARLLVSLRSPVARAYSNYRHDLARGALSPAVPFGRALAERPHLIEGSRYAAHLGRYLDLFPREQLLVLVYEDSLRDARRFVRQVYAFLGVEPDHVPASLGSRINAARRPRFPALDGALSGASRRLRERGLHRLWWYARGLGLGNRIRLGHWLRAANARRDPASADSPPGADEQALLWRALGEDVAWVERLLGRELPEWRPAPAGAAAPRSPGRRAT